MKRASLTVRPAKPKAETADLTDRLLPREPPPALRRKQPEPAASRVAAASRSKAPSPAPRASRTGGLATRARAVAPSSLQSVQSVTSVDTTVDKALAQCRDALAALKAAAGEAPARYEVAIRFRLDALAHHIRQVAEYLDSAARK